DSARLMPAAARLRSPASREAGRYSSTKRRNTCWSGAAARVEVSAANFGCWPAMAPVAPMAATTAMARAQGRMLRLFMSASPGCGSFTWTARSGRRRGHRLLLLALERPPRETDAPWRPAETPIPRLRAACAPVAACASPAEAGAHANRLLVAAERTTERDRGAVADRALVAHRQRAFAALEAYADAHPVRGADARSAGGHVQHRRPHRALAVDAAVLVGEPLLELGLVGREAVAPGVEALVGVGVRVAHRAGRGGFELGHVHRVGSLGARGHVRDLALVAGT